MARPLARDLARDLHRCRILILLWLAAIFQAVRAHDANGLNVVSAAPVNPELSIVMPTRAS